MVRKRAPAPFTNHYSMMGSGFNRMVLISIILHIAIFTGAFIWSRASPSRLFYAPVYTVELVFPPAPPARVKKRRATPPKVATKKAAQKRVKKAAPKKTTKKEPVTTALPVKKEAVSIDSTLKTIKERLRKRAEEANLEEKIERMKRERAEAAGRKSRIDKLRSEIRSQDGRIAPDMALSPAVRPSGRVSREQFDLKFKAYRQAVSERIRGFWIYTGPMVEGERAIVVIKIDDGGRIVERWIEKGSRVAQLNESALKAVDMATLDAPLPPPLEGMDREIAIRFCPAGCTE
ncbi:MAG: TonB C-terminal domain-containing protein [Thermodesulfobacteriota bacterium]